MDKDGITNAVELLELILLAKLVRFTGIVWDVRSDIQKWDFVFHCRYGAGRYDVFSTQCYDARDIEGFIENRMDNEVTELIQYYLKRKKKKGEGMMSKRLSDDEKRVFSDQISMLKNEDDRKTDLIEELEAELGDCRKLAKSYIDAYEKFAIENGLEELKAENERLMELLQDVGHSGVSFEDPRLDYKEVQLDVDLWQRIDALKEGGR